MRPVVKRVSAHIERRIVINFAVEPDAITQVVDCPWLRPQIVSGHGVASLCVLWMDGVIPTGWPKLLAQRQISIAVRFGVMNLETGKPGVYVPERCSNTLLAWLLTRMGGSCIHPKISVETGEAGVVGIKRNGAEFARFRVGGKPLESRIFACDSDFEAFFRVGERSYCPSLRKGLLDIADLHKSETSFHGLGVEMFDWAGIRQAIPGVLTLDSAYETCNADYEWEYIGQSAVVRGFDPKPLTV